MLPRLKYAENDATRFARAIQAADVGFKAIMPAAADLHSIIDQLSEIAGEANPADDLLFYFAGHGVVSYGDFYLVLRDTRQKRLDATALPYVNVQQIIKKCEARNKVVILDCCHAGEADGNRLGVRYRGGFDKETVASASRGSSASLLIACGPDGSARESDSFEGGVMTSLLIEALTTRPAGSIDDTSRISLESLRNWMWERMSNSPDPSLSRGDKPLLISSGGIAFYFNSAPVRGRRREGDRAGQDDKWDALILKHAEKIEECFRSANTIDPKRLQQLAEPLKSHARQLTGFDIIEKLVIRSNDQPAKDTGIFVAAVLLHERTPPQHLDWLISIVSKVQNLRGAAMWRLLRAIRRYLADTELSEEQRTALVTALHHCALTYDEPQGQRFDGNGILSLVHSIAKHRRLKLNGKFQRIYSDDQLAELEKRSRRPLANRSRPLEGGVEQPLLPLSMSILSDRIKDTNEIMRSLSTSSGVDPRMWPSSPSRKK
jgi:hypothetical protein